MKRLMIMMLSITLLSACNRGPSSGGNAAGTVKLYPLATDTANPTSIFLKLLDKTEGDSSVSYQVKGLYQDDTVGFTVEVNKSIPAGVNKDGSANEQEGFKRGVIKFKRSGPESDRFVAALAKLWQVNDAQGMKMEPIEPLVFSSNNKPVDIAKSATYSFKLFFDKGTSSTGEIFFTFDTYKRNIEFQEKNAQQRPAIVQAFAK